MPLKECRHRGIKVTYTPDAVTMAVAELTIGIMITLTRHVRYADMNIRRNIWERKQGKRIGKSVIGIIGFGRIGKNTVELLSSFKPKHILVNDIKDKSKEIEFFKMMLEYGYILESDITEKAALEILKNNPTDEELRLVMSNVPGLKDLAAKKYKSPSRVMRRIFIRVRDYFKHLLFPPNFNFNNMKQLNK